jgi:prophage DNA circulation protein
MPDLIPAGIGPLTQTAGTSLATDQSGASWLGSTWYQQLQPGSWRDVGFVMDAAENKAGRRTAIHEYPYRDTVWVEDLGRLPRRFSFQAFQVGDDVYQQRDAMIQACEQAGEGTLVHPTLGSVQCVLIDFTTTDRRERGRVVELAFSFVVSGDILFPATALATGDNVNAAAGALGQASAADLSSTLSAASFIPSMAGRAISGFIGLANLAVDDPTRALNAVAGLQGYYGRYSTGNRSVLQPPSATVQSVLADSITSRQAVLDAGTQLANATSALA